MDFGKLVKLDFYNIQKYILGWLEILILKTNYKTIKLIEHTYILVCIIGFLSMMWNTMSKKEKLMHLSEVNLKPLKGEDTTK